jgi:hypothetical protein
MDLSYHADTHTPEDSGYWKKEDCHPEKPLYTVFKDER